MSIIQTETTVAEARGTFNRIMCEIGPIADATLAFTLAASAISPLRAVAEKAGPSDFTPLWCGQN